jgi:hypothetical protein
LPRNRKIFRLPERERSTGRGESDAYWNNDGIDIADCTVRSSGSAIKFGTSSVGGFKKVRIRNIQVFDTGEGYLYRYYADGVQQQVGYECREYF